jgi:hypothetical protein
MSSKLSIPYGFAASAREAVGYIIPLMDEEYANYYTTQIMEILIREFASPDALLAGTGPERAEDVIEAFDTIWVCSLSQRGQR